MLTADQQRFLGHQYRHDAADIFTGHLDDVKRGMHGSYTVDVSFANCGQDGVGWCRAGEQSAGYTLKDWPRQIRWSAIVAHGDAQPQRLRDRLRDARKAAIAEERRHYDASHAINQNGYWKATPEQVEALDAEWQRHIVAIRVLRDAQDAALLDLLPLATDEPADLLEWAAAMEEEH